MGFFSQSTIDEIHRIREAAMNDAIIIRRYSYTSDGAGGQTPSTPATVYDGKADVQYSVGFAALVGAGLEERAYPLTLLPSGVAPSVEVGDELEWTDSPQGILTGTVKAIDERASTLTVSFDE